MYPLLVLILITQVKCEDTSDVSSSSSKCLLNIANKYFTRQPIISIFTNEIQEDLSVHDEILKSDKYVKRLFHLNKFQVIFFDPHATNVLIIVHNLQQELYNKTILNRLNLWSPRAKYIIYLHETINENILNEFVKLLWYYNIINTIILAPQNEQKINIYEFDGLSSCNRNISTKLINTCTDGLFQYDELFELFEKRSNPLAGCTIKVRAQIWQPLVYYEGNFTMNETVNFTEGIEVKMMNVISEFLNITPEYYSSTFSFDWGTVSRTGNASGAMKVLLDRQVDVVIGGFGMVTERQMYADYTEIFYFEWISWCVPHAQLSPRWKQLFNPFRRSAWLAMMLTFFMTSLIIWGFTRCQPTEQSLYSKLMHTFIYAYSIFLGVSAAALPKKFSTKLSFFFWIVFSLHFIVAYQAKLVNVLLTAVYEEQISTLEEMVASGLEHMIMPSQLRFFENTKDSRFDNIAENLKFCLDINECLQRIAYKRDAVFLIMQTYATLRSMNLRNDNGDSLVYFIPYIMTGPAWYLTKGHPLKDRFNVLIMRLRGGGFLYKWQKDIEESNLRKYLKTVSTASEEQILTVSHMQGAFAILTIGLGISAFVFVAEKTINICKYKLNRII